MTDLNYEINLMETVNWVNSFKNEDCALFDASDDLSSGVIFYALIEAIFETRVIGFVKRAKTHDQKTRNFQLILTSLNSCSNEKMPSFLTKSNAASDLANGDQKLLLDFLDFLRHVDQSRRLFNSNSPSFVRIEEIYPQQTTNRSNTIQSTSPTHYSPSSSLFVLSPSLITPFTLNRPNTLNQSQIDSRSNQQEQSQWIDRIEQDQQRDAWIQTMEEQLNRRRQERKMRKQVSQEWKEELNPSFKIAQINQDQQTVDTNRKDDINETEQIQEQEKKYKQDYDSKTWDSFYQSFVIDQQSNDEILNMSISGSDEEQFIQNQINNKQNNQNNNGNLSHWKQRVIEIIKQRSLTDEEVAYLLCEQIDINKLRERFKNKPKNDFISKENESYQIQIPHLQQQMHASSSSSSSLSSSSLSSNQMNNKTSQMSKEGKQRNNQKTKQKQIEQKQQDGNQKISPSQLCTQQLDNKQVLQQTLNKKEQENMNIFIKNNDDQKTPPKIRKIQPIISSSRPIISNIHSHSIDPTSNHSIQQMNNISIKPKQRSISPLKQNQSSSSLSLTLTSQSSQSKQNASLSQAFHNKPWNSGTNNNVNSKSLQNIISNEQISELIESIKQAFINLGKLNEEEYGNKINQYNQLLDPHLKYPSLQSQSNQINPSNSQNQSSNTLIPEYQILSWIKHRLFINLPSTLINLSNLSPLQDPLCNGIALSDAVSNCIIALNWQKQQKQKLNIKVKDNKKDYDKDKQYDIPIKPYSLPVFRQPQLLDECRRNFILPIEWMIKQKIIETKNNYTQNEEQQHSQYQQQKKKLILHLIQEKITEECLKGRYSISLGLFALLKQRFESLIDEYLQQGGKFYLKKYKGINNIESQSVNIDKSQQGNNEILWKDQEEMKRKGESIQNSSSQSNIRQRPKPKNKTKIKDENNNNLNKDKIDKQINEQQNSNIDKNIEQQQQQNDNTYTLLLHSPNVYQRGYKEINRKQQLNKEKMKKKLQQQQLLNEQQNQSKDIKGKDKQTKTINTPIISIHSPSAPPMIVSSSKEALSPYPLTPNSDQKKKESETKKKQQLIQSQTQSSNQLINQQRSQSDGNGNNKGKNLLSPYIDDLISKKQSNPKQQQGFNQLQLQLSSSLSNQSKTPSSRSQQQTTSKPLHSKSVASFNTFQNPYSSNTSSQSKTIKPYQSPFQQDNVPTQTKSVQFALNEDNTGQRSQSDSKRYSYSNSNRDKLLLLSDRLYGTLSTQGALGMPWTSTSPKLRTEEEVKKMVQLEYDEEQLRAVEAGLVTWIVQDLGIDILKNQKNKNKKDTKKNVKMNNEDEQIELEQQREQIVTFDMLMVEFERGFILKKIVEKALSIQFDDQKVLRKDPNSYFFRGLDDNKDNKIKQKWRWKDEDTNEQDKERSLSRMSRRQNVEQVLKALKGKNMPYYRFLNHGSQISSGNRHAIVGLLEDIRQFSKDLAGFKQFQTSNCPM